MALSMPPITVGFTCGSFDLLHAGHVLALRDARERCGHLVVGLQTDPSIDRAGKNAPVQTLEERRIQLEAVRYVDEVVVYETEADLLILLEKLPTTYMNVVRFLGSDWVGKPYTGHELPMRTVFTERTHSFSTTELRRRVALAASSSGPATPAWTGTKCESRCSNPRGRRTAGACCEDQEGA